MILDGNNILLRSLHAPVEHEMRRSDGVVTGVLYRCLNTMFRVIQAQKPTHFLVVFDHGKSTYRVSIRPEYKANRREHDDKKREENQRIFLHQLKMWQYALDTMYMTHMSSPRIEADDLIASAVENYDGEKVIVTEDHDLFQLVSPEVKVQKVSRSQGKPCVYGPQEVKERYGVEPQDLLKMWALVGDKGDNVIGLHRVGEKTALKALIAHDMDFNATVDALAKTEDDKKRVVENYDLIALHPELCSEMPDFDGLGLDYTLLKEDITLIAQEFGFNRYLRDIDTLI